MRQKDNVRWVEPTAGEVELGIKTTVITLDDAGNGVARTAWEDGDGWHTVSRWFGPRAQHDIGEAASIAHVRERARHALEDWLTSEPEPSELFNFDEDLPS